MNIIKSRDGGLTYLVKGNVNELMNWIDRKDPASLTKQINRERLTESKSYGNRIDFFGGCYADFFNPIEKKTMDRLSKTKLDVETKLNKLNISTHTYKLSRRRRFRSEHDGDFCYDREFDIEPFDNCKSDRVANQIITIIIHFANHGGIDPNTINQYGAVVWSVIQIIESCGFMVKLIYSKVSGSFLYNSKVMNKCVFEIVLKEPNEYLEPSLLAKYLTCNFYRRVILGSLALVAEEDGMSMSSCAGEAIVSKYSAHFENGVLHLSNQNSYEFSENMLNVILKVISNKKQSNQ